jgi:hypothetical protein
LNFFEVSGMTLVDAKVAKQEFTITSKQGGKTE